jgi:hypothetical protein
MGQAGYPSDLICCRESPVPMPPSVIVSATKSTADGIAILLMERTASTVTGRTAKPWTSSLFTSKRPFLLQLDNLDMAIDRDSDLSPAETTDP